MFDFETSRIYRIQFHDLEGDDGLVAFIFNDEFEWWCQLVKSIIQLLRMYDVEYSTDEDIHFYQKMCPHSRRYYPFKLDLKDPKSGEMRPFILIENQSEDDDD